MKPIIVLVGRPNVGKSTLFNRLTRSRDALVADFPGLTRDRHYGEGRLHDIPHIIVDTGGFEPVVKDGIVHEMARQTQQAVIEADVVIFMVDARSGLMPQDLAIVAYLRKVSKHVILVANKAEGMRRQLSFGITEFYELGLGDVHVISAAHGDGVADLIDLALTPFSQDSQHNQDNQHSEYNQDDQNFLSETLSLNKTDNKKPNKNYEFDGNQDSPIKLAIVGRPNVGKSTLINTLVGEERVIAFDSPGTTRDAISIDFERKGKKYTLIDTAGLRRRGKVFEAVEKFSVIKTLQAIEKANVVVLLIDAQQEVSEQDAHIAGFIVEQGRALVIGINKWDGLDEYAKKQILKTIDRKLNFLEFANKHPISARLGEGINNLLHSVDQAYQAAFSKLSTPRLTRALIDATSHQPPQRKGSFRPKLRFAHQGGRNPPIVIIHGNALDSISTAYKRYLIRKFRETFNLVGTPLRVEFRSTTNPYDRTVKNKQ